MDNKNTYLCTAENERKKQMTLNEAWADLTSRHAWCNLVGLTPQGAQSYKVRDRAGTLGDDAKRRLLRKSGIYEQVEQWVCTKRD